MSYYEYRVVPAPAAAPRAKGVKGTDARYAHGLADALNREGRDGWEFQRTESMVVEAGGGFFSRARAEPVTVMIFRRWVETAPVAAPAPATAAAPRAVPSARSDTAAPPAQGTGLTASRKPRSPFHPIPTPDRG